MAYRARWLALAVTTVTLGHCAASAQSAGNAPEAQTITLHAQGGDYAEFFQNPNMHAFYDLSVAMLREPSVDVAAYEQRSYEIFRALAVSLGWPPEGMVDHLKNIPRELVGIVKEDPKVLDSFESFLVALRGPP
jgi:hypothetical protein